MSMLRQRSLVWFIGVALLITVIWCGGWWWFTFLVSIVAVFGSLEFYRMASQAKIHPLSYFGVAWSLLFVLSPLLYQLSQKYDLPSPDVWAIPFLITLAVLISLIWLLFQLPREQAFNNWAWIIAGVFYVGWMTSYWVSLRIEFGRELVLLGLLVIVANDTAAFLVGKTWGRHRMAQNVSPSKTWEGAVGGFFAAIAVSLLMGIIYSLVLDYSLPLGYLQLVLMGCVLSVFAQLGDLVESLLKRNSGVKDSGNLLPGHGGILDRIDSLIFAAPVLYYFLMFSAGLG